AHPNLIGFRELITVGGEWFFTMDLVDGVELLRWVRPASLINQAEVPTEVPTATDGVVIGLADTVPGSMTSPPSGSRPGSRGGQRARTEEEAPHRPLCVADLPRVRSAFEQLANGLIALHKAGMI